MVFPISLQKKVSNSYYESYKSNSPNPFGITVNYCILVHLIKPRTPIHGCSFVLGKEADEEVGLCVRLEGGGHQKVGSRWQPEAFRDLPHVDVGTAACFRAVIPEEVLPLLVLVIWSLWVHHTSRVKFSEKLGNPHQSVTS